MRDALDYASFRDASSNQCASNEEQSDPKLPYEPSLSESFHTNDDDSELGPSTQLLDDPPGFVHHRLNNSFQEIRLLLLHPSHDPSAIIECSLQVVSRDFTEPYEACHMLGAIRR